MASFIASSDTSGLGAAQNASQSIPLGFSGKIMTPMLAR
jgi:acetoacetate decarboxylase